MLHEFITAHRGDLVALWSYKCAKRIHAEPAERYEVEFLDSLAESMAPEDMHPEHMLDVAAERGVSLLEAGLGVESVIHEYGDVCQAITELAARDGVLIPAKEFGLLNLRLDGAMAAAVAEYAHQRELVQLRERAHAVHQRIGAFADELRALLADMERAVARLGDATARAGLEPGLEHLREAVDRSLAQIRLESGMTSGREAVALDEVLAELAPWAQMEARWSGCAVEVGVPRLGLVARVDRPLLGEALRQLIRTALRATPRGGRVSVRAAGDATHVRVEVEDGAGGFSAERAAHMARLLAESGPPKGPLGLEPAISKRNAEELGGRLLMRNTPGTGCVFALELPRDV